MKTILIGMSLFVLTSCGTILSISEIAEDPCKKKHFPRYLYGGVILDSYWIYLSAKELQPIPLVQGLIDLPFSLTFDTMLLPVTVLKELSVTSSCGKSDAEKLEIVKSRASSQQLDRIGVVK